MFGFDKSNFRQFAISSLGALAMSAACVFGAVGPAKAATAHSVAANSGANIHIAAR